MGGINLGFVFWLGGEPDFDLSSARIETDFNLRGLKTGFFEKGYNVGLTYPLGMNHANESGFGIGMAFSQPWDDFFVENGVEFAGRSGEDK